jgi:hypothetical protein
LLGVWKAFCPSKKAEVCESHLRGVIIGIECAYIPISWGMFGDGAIN